MSRRLPVALALTLIVSALAGSTLAREQATPERYLYLQRATFDPLRTPALAASDRVGDGGLLIVQLDGPADAAAHQRLADAGLRPLAYLPEHAFIVRAAPGAAPTATPGVRWAGQLAIPYRIPPDLDALLGSADPTPVDLRLLATPDADPAALAAAVGGAGGTVLEQASGPTGPLLHLQLPARALGALVARDDVLWIERHHPVATLDDRSNPLVGATAAQQQLGLTGAGQVIAVTDTGLDVRGSLSPDFAGRLVAAFTPRQMNPRLCTEDDWSDFSGHGTHVAGIAVGNGARSDGRYAGVAPQAGLVFQAVANVGLVLSCLPNDSSFLESAYAAGARIQNGSFGAQTSSGYGAYTTWDQQIDDFLWRNPEHLFVVAAGNSAFDAGPLPDGLVDPDSIMTPGTAKNVLTVGASENNRPPAASCPNGTAECRTYQSFGFFASPLGADRISDSPQGLAAFSGRGPTDDGRIKPELVAPGTNVVSTRGPLASPGFYLYPVSESYAYLSGTSMATPHIAGLAALAREWLARHRLAPTPSAALVKALLLNGALNLRPGQYSGVTEIPGAWPNSVIGWGRASIADSIGLGGDDRVWLAEGPALAVDQVVEYPLSVSGAEPLRVTLAWTDRPGIPSAGRMLVNDLDLEVVGPDGTQRWQGNQAAELRSGCVQAGADRCNNVEAVEIASPAAGTYTVRVRAYSIPSSQYPQPFALAARAERVVDLSLSAPTLQPVAVSGPLLSIGWGAAADATFYRVQIARAGGSAWRYLVDTTSFEWLGAAGSYEVQVSACNVRGCGPASAPRDAAIVTGARRVMLPLVRR